MKSKFIRRTALFTERYRHKSIGYARQGASKKIPIDSQVEELKKAGCVLVFQEPLSKNNKERPYFDLALRTLNEGDEIVLTQLDRGFTNQRQCINTLHYLQKKGIHIRTTDGMVDTRALGKFGPIIFGLLSGLGEIKRQIVIEKTQESVNSRKEKGKSLGGRPKTNKEKEALVIRLRSEGCSYRSIRTQTGLALSTIRRIILEEETIAA
tara:strand:+ start:443 stop:1069 length:627 start_codon:yes stop_codon:yes gene_type:complete